MAQFPASNLPSDDYVLGRGRPAPDALAGINAQAALSDRLRPNWTLAADALEALPDAVVCLDGKGTILCWNRAAGQMFGMSADDVAGKTLDIILPSRPNDAGDRHLRLALASAPITLAGTSTDLTASHADGRLFPVELSLADLSEQPGNQGFVAVIRDISARVTFEDDRQRTNALLREAFANFPGVVSVKDARTHQYLLVNHVAEQLLGQPAHAIIGRTPRDFLPIEGPRFERCDDEALAAGTPIVIETARRRADGSIAHYRTTHIAIDDPGGAGKCVLAVDEDITDIRRIEANAELDTLTGLVNRNSYIARVNRLLAAGTPFALLKVDIDRFRTVNDEFGVRRADEMLVETASRLRALAGPADLVSRTGSNHFMVILLGNRPDDRAQRLAGRVVKELARPFVAERMIIHSGACVGAVLSADIPDSLDELRLHIELALHEAKRQGRGSICCFNPEMADEARERRIFEDDLRDALQAGTITLAYQPIVSAETGTVVSVEALARWTHPQKGPVRPDIFIPMAEQCGLIHELGEYVLRQACSDAVPWPDHIGVAVNLSPLQFRRGDLYATVCDVLRATGLSPDRLQLEVTEGLVIQDVDRTFDELVRLRSHGIQILMDDFGVGYSSLSYFERFPFDKVKIDKSFVGGLSGSLAAEAIIKAVIELGHRLGMGVVAEGVETDEQVRLLMAAGCTHLQGYHFSRPVDASAVMTLIEQGGWELPLAPGQSRAC